MVHRAKQRSSRHASALRKTQPRACSEVRTWKSTCLPCWKARVQSPCSNTETGQTVALLHRKRNTLRLFFPSKTSSAHISQKSVSLGYLMWYMIDYNFHIYLFLYSPIILQDQCQKQNVPILPLVQQHLIMVSLKFLLCLFIH